MSRVFEALTKAAEAKFERSVDVESALAVEAFAETRGLTPDQRSKTNGAVNKVSGTVHETPELFSSIPKHDKSWLERFEQWLYGWALQHYSSHPIVALETESPGAEQYKILREQIKRLRSESGIKSFSISSAVKRDGKTTVAVNLAASLSLDYGEKVLLIDGDLRAPGVHRYFSTLESPGLSDYLTSDPKMHLENLVQETFVPGLLVLPSGKPSNLASELLAKDRMKQLMEEAQVEFPDHHIIIDSPPILSTPDPLVIARYVDGVLLVIRAGKTPREYLRKALQSINSSKVMGVVLNDADLGSSTKYYYYSTNDAQ